MHSVLVTFKNEAPLDQLAGELSKAAEEIREAPGLVSKAWLKDGDMLGGFYVFTNRDAAESYMEHAKAGLKEVPVFSNIEIRHFEMLDELSILNGTPAQALAER